MKQNHKLLIGTLAGFGLMIALSLIPPAGQVSLAAEGILYVNADASGVEDGTSWADAFSTLQPALAAAAPGDQIWVAAGTYLPTLEAFPGDPRSAAFQLKNDVALYGGFDPSKGDSTWEQRDWAANVTILSGDLNGDDGPDLENNGENSYHVFYHFGESLDSSAILDGFTITAGNANDSSWPHNTGGGMYNVYASPTLTNCIFRDNSAMHGGGMANSYASPLVTNCVFSGNVAEYGGGMENYDQAFPILTNVIFTDNSGSAMRNNLESAPTLTNCTLVGNVGYAIDNWEAETILTNCILWGNLPGEIYDEYSTLVISYSDVQGGYPGEGILNANPLFVDAANDNFHLLPDSTCIDAGSNIAPSIPGSDLDGEARILDGDRDGSATVDMGVDEVPGYRIYLPVTLRR